MDEECPRSRIVILACAGLCYLFLGVFSDWWLRIYTNHPVGFDFFIYYDAYLKAKSGLNPYLPFQVGSSFIYHPSALTLVSLVGWLPPRLAYQLWAMGGILAWAISAQIILREIGRRTALTKFQSNLIFLYFLTFAPFLEGAYLGQINAFTILAILLALTWSETGHNKRAGFALACAVVWKSSPILFAVFLIARKRYWTVLWTGVGVLLLSSLAVLQFTPSVFVDYWPTLEMVRNYVELGPYNESLGSFLVKPLANGGWNPSELLSAGRTICGLFFLGWAAQLWIRFRERALVQSSLLAFCFLLLLSPLVWYHHLMFVLPPLAFLFGFRNISLVYLGLALGCLIQAQRYFDYAFSPFALPVNLALVTLSVFYWFDAFRRVPGTLEST